MRVLVTGATGFVGRALVARLRADSHTVRATVRTPATSLPDGVEPAVLDIAEGDPDRATAGVDAVVHLAARVHVMHDRAANPLAEFRRVNVDGTARLAAAAARNGVTRFVFVSSIKVNGESGRVTESTPPAPADPYGVSKREAEDALRAIAAATGMAVTIVRPPLVYGPGVRANFAALVRAVERGLPLPFASVRNRRSLVAVDNLVDFVVVCLTHPGAANETFLVSDGDDLSTGDLVRRLATALGRPARLWPCPPWVLKTGAGLVGRRAAAARLLDSLQADITKARTRLQWTPPVTVEEGLRRVVRPA